MPKDKRNKINSNQKLEEKNKTHSNNKLNFKIYKIDRISQKTR